MSDVYSRRNVLPLSSTHHLLLDTISYTIEDFLYDIFVVSIRFVIAETHHPPAF